MVRKSEVKNARKVYTFQCSLSCRSSLSPVDLSAPATLFPFDICCPLTSAEISSIFAYDFKEIKNKKDFKPYLPLRKARVLEPGTGRFSRKKLCSHELKLLVTPYMFFFRQEDIFSF